MKSVRQAAVVGAAKALAAAAPEFWRSKLERPLFIVGCGRSGTTLLGRKLLTRDFAVYPTEANELWHPHLYPWHTSRSGVAPFWVDPYAFTAASIAMRQPVDGQRIGGIFGAFQSLERRACFLNKSVMLSFMIPEVLRLFPEGRFIHLVRDGRAVALSYALKESEKVRAHSAYARRGYAYPFGVLLDRFAAHWSAHVREIERQKAELDLVQKGKLLELRYEELCSDPTAVIDRLASFAGVGSARHAGMPTVVAGANGKYVSFLDGETIDRITRIMESALRLKGYELGVADPLAGG